MKEAGVAYILWLGCCIGFCGLHRFYLDSFLLGIIWFFTGGILGWGQLIDLILIPGMVEDCNRKYGQPTVTTAVTNVTYQTQPVVQQPYVPPQQAYVPPQQAYMPPQQGYIPPQQGYVQQTTYTTATY
ncbi:hypothetical protein C9374_007823 [Naegleria lovaniensis]|uniref:TM2 domain-containing protein n=1 Tax=Naegleria lovaniensis TaxID=51637 RepID=A0AA88GKA9_NAELO|nr:uncharacterized protein C9374_007823 [Naegleria lovaniensis]KAG2378675.1 hypothetical protein C9374_007823 [Naegleria lovaniensis]